MENTLPVNLSERCYPGLSQQRVFSDHVERYKFASRFVAGMTVVDLGSGEGYGANMLREAGAVRVVGIDADQEVIALAQKKYPSVEFISGNATDTKLPDHIADLVVCFEVWHHLSDYEQLVSEVSRILKKGGTFICSVPNKNIIYLNPFHKKMLTEFYRVDFDKKAILTRLLPHFSACEWYGQRFVKPFFAHVLVRIGFFVLDFFGLCKHRIDHIYKLGNGPQVRSLGSGHARTLVVVATQQE